MTDNTPVTRGDLKRFATDLDEIAAEWMRGSPHSNDAMLRSDIISNIAHRLRDALYTAEQPTPPEPKVADANGRLPDGAFLSCRARDAICRLRCSTEQCKVEDRDKYHLFHATESMGTTGGCAICGRGLLHIIHNNGRDLKAENGAPPATETRARPFVPVNVGDTWKHVKSGGIYKVVGFSKREEDQEIAVLYLEKDALEGVPPWDRKMSLFTDGRFIKLVDEEEAAPTDAERDAIIESPSPSTDSGIVERTRALAARTAEVLTTVFEVRGTKYAPFENLGLWIPNEINALGNQFKLVQDERDEADRALKGLSSRIETLEKVREDLREAGLASIRQWQRDVEKAEAGRDQYRTAYHSEMKKTDAAVKAANDTFDQARAASYEKDKVIELAEAEAKRLREALEKIIQIRAGLTGIGGKIERLNAICTLAGSALAS